MLVVVWLKIRKNDIIFSLKLIEPNVVVWLKIRKNDIYPVSVHQYDRVVVWLKIRINDISVKKSATSSELWFD